MLLILEEIQKYMLRQKKSLKLIFERHCQNQTNKQTQKTDINRQKLADVCVFTCVIK